ncbi:tetratricopeptide repeat protein [Paenibacillus amylolyticus]|uniref:tetratricopeptide repeat protein n=1 Tax=Paenibacillus amylolyticus TaxID=1451 RepID=UPI003450B38D
MHKEPSALVTHDEIRLGISFEDKLFHSFYGLKECWWQLQDVIERHYPELKQQFSAELQFLFPETSLNKHTEPLEALAAGSSERRLSKESEQIFRLVWGISKLIQLVSYHRPLQIRFYNVAEADRVSLQFISYLSSQKGNIDLQVHVGEVPTSWDEECKLLRDELLQMWKKNLHETEENEERKKPVNKNRSLSFDEKTALSWFQNRESMYAYDMEEIIQRFVMGGNYEAALTLIQGGIHTVCDKERLATLWMKKGLVYAFCGNYSKAIVCYKHLFSLSTSPQKRTATCMYLALLSSKRLDQEDEAQSWIEKGLQEAVLLEGKEADIEKGWLYNVRALSAFREKNYREALQYSQAALKRIMNHQAGDALHLKINVISNLSVLFEKMGLSEKALTTWQKFEQFITHGTTAAFSKTYYFRLGALQVASGQQKEGIAYITRAYEIAKRIDDVFHAAFIAQELAIYSYNDDDFAQTVHWLEHSASMALEFGDEAFASLQVRRIKLVQQNESLIIKQELDLGSPLTKIGRPFYPIHIPNPLIQQ